MTLVIDASVTLAWFFEDERTDAIAAVMYAVNALGAVVPPLWRYEVANGLQVAVRRRRIDEAYRDASLSDLQLIPLHHDPDCGATAWSATLLLADRYQLTVYDAAYLELAQRRALPLATLDRDLAAAARAVGVAPHL